jgi:hypothetical protein
VEVGIKTSGGHSSRPPINHTSAAAVMARVITAIDQHPLPPLLKQPVLDFLLGLAPRWVRWWCWRVGAARLARPACCRARWATLCP